MIKASAQFAVYNGKVYKIKNIDQDCKVELESASKFLLNDISADSTSLANISMHDIDRFSHAIYYLPYDDILDKSYLDINKIGYHDVLSNEQVSHNTYTSFNEPTVVGHAIINDSSTRKSRSSSYTEDYEYFSKLQRIVISESRFGPGCSDASWHVKIEDIETYNEHKRKAEEAANKVLVAKSKERRMQQDKFMSYAILVALGVILLILLSKT